MRRATALLTAAAAAAVLTGCAPSSPDAIEAAGLTEETANDPVVPTGPGGAISIESGDLFFQNLEGTPVDGAIEVTLVNIGDAEHNVRIDNAAGDDVKVSALGGETTVGELLLFGQPGGLEYVYYCDIPGHREAGMEGTLLVYATVEEAQEGPIGTVVPM
jgi:nitrite reductase (NO-forming)